MSPKKTYRPLSPSLVAFLIGWKRSINSFDPRFDPECFLRLFPAEVIQMIIENFNELPFPFCLKYFSTWTNSSRLTCGDGLNRQFNLYRRIRLKSYVIPEEFYLKNVLMPCRKVEYQCDDANYSLKRPIEGKFNYEDHSFCNHKLCEYKWEHEQERKKMKIYNIIGKVGK